jgi:hypothetical protein
MIMSKKYYVERKAENLWLVAAEDGSDAKEFYEQSRAIRHCSEMNSNHCIAELEAALTEARSWIGDGEDSICSFAYPKECSSDYVEMVNRVDAVLGKGGAV